jgi:glycosyltransferase involved in cell wall biosynthesis
VKKLPITVTIITLDEEANISRCIGSVPFASEIVVVDSFSKDRTVEIAARLGAQVFTEKWLGYGPQKALATKKASFDWILNLDADEIVSEELQKELETKFASLDPKIGYLIPRKSYYLGRWISHGGWYPDLQKRLFHRGFSNWDQASIHETVVSPADAKLKSSLSHFVFDSIFEQVETNNKYSTLLAERLFNAGQRFSVFRLIGKPLSKFIETYFYKRGLLDGLPGFIIAVGAAYSVFLKWAKLWDLERSRK